MKITVQLHGHLLEIILIFLCVCFVRVFVGALKYYHGQATEI